MNLRISTYVLNDNNYGQRLQAYALQQFISKYFNSIPLIYDKRNESTDNFSQFESEFMKFKHITCDDDVLNDDFDMLIHGGDQVLNKNIQFHNTLQYVNDIPTKKKILYSASDGGDFTNRQLSIDELFKLSSYKAISFRENSTLKSYSQNCKNKKFKYLCKLTQINNCNKTVCCNIDPIFLLNRDDWNKLAIKPNINIQQDFYFIYDVFKKQNYEINEDIQKIYAYANIDGQYGTLKFTPNEWLWLIIHCKKFFTNSFHGLAFSILFNKNIYVHALDTRKQNLIELFNIKNISDIPVLDFTNILNTHIHKSFLYFKENIIDQQFAAFSKDNNIRNKSTSGGISFQFAKYAFNNNGLVFGVSYSSDFNELIYKQVNNEDDFLKYISGSKYSISNIRPYINEIIEALKYQIVIVFGLPCQIKILKHYIKNNDNLIAIDLICGGASTNSALKKYVIDKYNKHNSHICYMNMRHNHIYELEYIVNNITYYDKDIFKYFFSEENMSLQCQSCDMHTSNNVSDITIGDFWQFNKLQHNNKFNPFLGTNIIKIHSEKGLNLFNKIKHQIEYISLSY